jgi:GTP-binding protein
VLHSAFVLSAASASDFPRTGLPEIAMVGRSNVGKSTLINALVRKALARTSAAPGKTRLANYYLIQSPIPTPLSLSFYLVDLPGYGYARGGQSSADAFQALTAEYFAIAPESGRSIAGTLHLIDARHPALPQDAAAHQWVAGTRHPTAIVATKMDKLKQNDRAKAVRALQTRYSSPVVAVSSLNGSGVDEVWKLLRQWLGVVR